jgi:protein involved in polysaccharide export with SLBB domain
MSENREVAMSSPLLVQAQTAVCPLQSFKRHALVWPLLFWVLPLNATADEYRLGAQDKLRIKVVEWKADKTEYFNWDIFAGEYAVSASGIVSLPLIGSLPAEGMTPDEFSATVAETLQKRAGLSNRPEAAVEIIQYRPIYVVGDVERPGEYAFRPGLTVQQAVGLSSGFYRQTEPSPIRPERDRISAVGTYENARLEMHRALVRRARLTAELAESEQIPVPEQLRNDADTLRLIADETAVMNARRDALRSQLAANAELKTLFSKEIDSLEQKVAVQDKQIALARRELKNISTLVEKGLVVSSREFTLERTVADLESKMLDYATATLRARQEISKADRNGTDLKAQRKATIVTELQETNAALDQLQARLATAESLANEAIRTTPRLTPDRSPQTAQRYSFWIVRRNGGNSVKIAADEDTVVKPGDVVRVEQVAGEDLSTIGPSLSAASDTPNAHPPPNAN